jgi:hypothetical protein
MDLKRGGFMEIRVATEVFEPQKNYYNVNFEFFGKYLSIDEEIKLRERRTCFYANSKEDLQVLIDERIKEFEVIAEEELMLKSFIKNIREYGYSRKLAIKEVIRDGFKVGFNYDFMGSATIDRINNKSFTITDICNRKHYIDEKYINSLLLNQFYVVKE